MNRPWGNVTESLCAAPVSVYLKSIFLNLGCFFLIVLMITFPWDFKGWKCEKINMRNINHRMSVLCDSRYAASERRPEARRRHPNMAATWVYHLGSKRLSLYLVQKSFYSPASSLVTLPAPPSPPPRLSLTVSLLPYEIDWSLFKGLAVARSLSEFSSRPLPTAEYCFSKFPLSQLLEAETPDGRFPRTSWLYFTCPFGNEPVKTLGRGRLFSSLTVEPDGHGVVLPIGAQGRAATRHGV